MDRPFPDRCVRPVTPSVMVTMFCVCEAEVSSKKREFHIATSLVCLASLLVGTLVTTDSDAGSFQG